MGEVIVDQSWEIVTFHVMGTLHYHELVNAYEQHGHLVAKHVCWHFTEGATMKIDFEPLRQFYPVAARCMPNRCVGGRTAFVASTDADFGTFRYYTTVSELAGSPIKYHVFRAMPDAMYWLSTGQLAG